MAGVLQSSAIKPFKPACFPTGSGVQYGACGSPAGPAAPGCPAVRARPQVRCSTALKGRPQKVHMLQEACRVQPDGQHGSSTSCGTA